VRRPNPPLARLAGVAVLSLALAAAAAPSRAAAAFKVYPTVLDLDRAPGAAALGAIDVKLSGEAGQRFRTVIEDIGQRPDGSQVYTPASGSRFSASSWVSVSPRSFSGAPDRVQPIQYRVTVPPGAEPGDHLASLTVQRLSGNSEGATAAAIEAVSVRLTIRVRGKVRPAAQITKLEVPGVANGGPVDVTAAVRNSGNVTLDFEGANRGGVTIRAGDARKARLEPFAGKLFPGQTREFVSSWDDPPLFGSFDAEASVRTGAGSARRSAGFLVVPWRELGALLLTIAAVAIFALGWRRRRWGY
jgi:hypothetical protein